MLEKGIDVYNLGMTPTPVAFREAKKIGAGIIITSSHNPLEWNGLKFILEWKRNYRKRIRDQSRNEKNLNKSENRKRNCCKIRLCFRCNKNYWQTR